MNNKEKATKIMETFTEVYGVNIERDSHIYSTCMQMAKWKDEQFNDEKKELLGLVNMLPIDDRNQTIIEDLKGLLTI